MSLSLEHALSLEMYVTVTEDNGHDIHLMSYNAILQLQLQRPWGINE